MRKVALVLALVCVAVAAQATPIFSDGFNFVGTQPSFTIVYGGETIGPWTVGGDSVDHIGTYWMPAEGNGSVDVSGLAAGSLSTSLSTVAGQVYTLTFYLAGNTQGGSAVKSLLVQVGSLNQVFTFDITGHSADSMGWVLTTASFTAAGNDTLTFTSLEQNVFGPALDGVTVSEGVPEPATYAFALLGLAGMGLGLFRRRR